MGKRGPAGKPLSLLKLEGRFREGEHGHRESQPIAHGTPVKPEGMSAEASAEWDQLLPKLMKSGLVGDLDAGMLQLCCETFVAAVKARDEMAGGESSARRDYVSLTQLYLQCATKLGLSPLDRSRITLDKPKDETPAGLSAFSRKRG